LRPPAWSASPWPIRKNIISTTSRARWRCSDVMRAAGCNRLVFSSTGAVYGNADSKALPENYDCTPINPYGASKWMIERVLADYRGAYGLGSFALRYFQRQRRRSGRRHRRAAGGRNPSHFRAAMMALQGLVGDFAVFRRRLRHARRHCDPRLYPCHRSGGGRMCRR